MNQNETYSTTDIALCTALNCKGYVIADIKQKPYSNKVVFTFNKDGEMDDIIQHYFDHKLNVDALSYFNCLKEAKNRIFNLRG